MARHDQIDYGLLEAALAGVPADQAAQVREACARWTRRRFAVDATPYPRPDAECSPDRGHVHHDACRCDGTRKTIPGWEYQFVAAVGHLRTAWAALIDVERTTAATRTRQTIRQVQNLLRRLAEPAGPAAGARRWSPRRRVQRRRADRRPGRTARASADPAAVRQRALRDPVTWPGKKGRPGKHGMAVTCHNDPGQANPEPDESLVLPDTPLYGTVRVGAWHQVHPLIHGDRGWFAGWDGDLPVLRGTVLRVKVERLPDGRKPHKTMWLWHAGPAPLSLDELWRAYLARFDEEHAFRFAKGTLGLTAAKVRTPEQADRWVRLVMAAFAQLVLARPLAADLRRPWERPPDPARPATPGRVRRGFPDIRPRLGTPARVGKPTRPGPGRPKGSARGPAPRHPVPAKSRQTDKQETENSTLQVKPKHIEVERPGSQTSGSWRCETVKCSAEPLISLSKEVSRYGHVPQDSSPWVNLLLVEES